MTQTLIAQDLSCEVVKGGSSVRGSNGVLPQFIVSGTLSLSTNGDSICAHAVTADSTLVVKGYNKLISGDTTRWTHSVVIFGSDTLNKDFMPNMPLEFFPSGGHYVLRFWKEYNKAGYGGLLDAAIFFDCIIVPPVIPCDSIVYISTTDHVDTSACLIVSIYDTLRINFCGDTLMSSGIDSFMLDNTITLMGVPADTTVMCLGNCPDVSTVVSAISSCSNFVSLSFERIIVDSNNCNGLIWQIWTATDGNIVVSDTQKVSIKNTIPPVLIDAPADLTISCEDQLPGVENLVAVDNCGILLDVHSFRSLLNPRECDQIVQTDYIAVDACGHMVQMRHNIYLVDTVGPVLNHNAADTIYTDPSNFVFEWVDICSVVMMSDTMTIMKNDSICIFIMTASDACGNISTDSIVYKKAIEKEVEIDPEVEKFLKCDFTIFPTPVGNGPLSVRWGGIEGTNEAFLEIWDRGERLIESRQVDPTKGFIEVFDLANLSSNVFYVRMRSPLGFRTCTGVKKTP